MLVIQKNETKACHDLEADFESIFNLTSERHNSIDSLKNTWALDWTSNKELYPKLLIVIEYLSLALIKESSESKFLMSMLLVETCTEPFLNALFEG
jgi:hypothetical protein